MILNINIFKAGQYICYAGLFTFVFFLLDNNPLNNIFFYLMILCMIGIDYFSFYNGAIQGTDKAIKQFTEQINIRENILNKLDSKSREITENKLNND
jgi:hypothetical protein|tara:strand:+ start:945 stop:1235 length:291 start_codon:yes stop_codon:yes gene_type:complete